MLGGLLHGCPLAAADGQHRPLEPRLVGVAPARSDQPQPLHMGPAEAGGHRPGRGPRWTGPAAPTAPPPARPPASAHQGPPGRTPSHSSTATSGVQRIPGLLAHLPVGPHRAHRPAPERRALQERERQPPRPDRRRRSPPSAARPARTRWPGGPSWHAGLQERAGALPGDQDAELDQPLDLGLGHAERGRLRLDPPTARPYNAEGTRGYSESWGACGAQAAKPSPAGGSSGTVPRRSHAEGAVDMRITPALRDLGRAEGRAQLRLPGRS